nr:hypothetical protein [Streptomyces sp. TRM49041]
MRAMGAMGEERGARAARARALAVLRVRGRALAVALLPAAVAVVLLTGGVTGQLAGPGWDAARWAVSGVAGVVLLAAAGVGAVVARARPALTPTVEITEASAPDLYRMVRDLASRLAVPAPSAIALTPDCDSWLEDRTHPAHRISAGGGSRGTRGTRGTRGGVSDAAPVLVIGSPFLWWMRVGELRAVLAPVVAGTGPSAHPDIAAARRFVRGLDAAVALADRPGIGAVRRVGARGVSAVARLMLRAAGGHAAEMERGVAAAASERAQAVDYGLRIVAQEQVGLAYAGWDRLLTRVALPAWRMGRWPTRLDAGVVSALTELSRRDRLAEGFTSRLGERPACDLLEEPGLVDEATSLLAARLFHGGPAEPGPGWAPVDWQQYPEEVVDRKWRTEAARLHRALDRLGARPATPEGPTLARVLDHLSTAHDGDTLAAAITAELSREEARRPMGATTASVGTATLSSRPATDTSPNGGTEALGAAREPAPGSAAPGSAATGAGQGAAQDSGAGPGDAYGGDTGQGAAAPDGSRSPGSGAPGDAPAHRPGAAQEFGSGPTAGAGLGGAGGSGFSSRTSTGAAPGAADSAPDTGQGAAQDSRPGVGGGDPGPASAARLGADRVAPTGKVAAPSESASGVPGSASGAPAPGAVPPTTPVPYVRGADELPLLPLQPPRTGRELLADHVTAMVCCAVVDTAGAVPGLDWLDGPVLLVAQDAGRQRADVAAGVLALIEDADPEPLRSWLTAVGARPEKPVRLV